MAEPSGSVLGARQGISLVSINKSVIADKVEKIG
jgi:hypothetical protein